MAIKQGWSLVTQLDLFLLGSAGRQCHLWAMAEVIR